MTQPLGVADWETQLVDKLPESLAGSLPTVEQIEAELSDPETATQASKRKTARKQPTRKQVRGRQKQVRGRQGEA